jgi:hypothetical protein
MKISVVGLGAEYRNKHILLKRQMNSIVRYNGKYWASYKKPLDAFFLNKKELNRPKTHLTLLSFKALYKITIPLCNLC